jgi:hypothetical protein
MTIPLAVVLTWTHARLVALLAWALQIEVTHA